MTPNGTAIRALREAQSLSLRELSGLTRISPSQLSRIERGLVGASDETIRRLAEVFRCPPTDITRGDNVPAKAQNPPRKVPYPGTPEGEVFHYTPEEAERFLPWSALQLRRKAYAREIPYNSGASRITFTGKNIREISDMTEVRPLSETTGLTA